MRKYLKHREDRVRQQWAQGLDWSPESAAHVELLSDIEALSFDDVEEFYGGGETDMSQGDDGTVYATINRVNVPDEKLGLYPEEEDDGID